MVGLTRTARAWYHDHTAVDKVFFCGFKISYEFFGKSFFQEGSTQASLAGHVHWQLGHAVLGDEVIAYQSLVLSPKPALKLFELSRNLKIIYTRDLHNFSVIYIIPVPYQNH